MTQVVRIITGEIKEAKLFESNWGGTRVWFPEHLRKDGEEPSNRHCNGHIDPRPSYESRTFALYDPEREREATYLRERIEQARDKLDAAQRDLITLYRESTTGGGIR